MDAFLAVGMVCYLLLGGIVAYAGSLLIHAPRIEWEVGEL